MERPIKITVITHYHQSDPDFHADYWGVTVEFDGEEVAKFGDEYHDKGEDKAQGFVCALTLVDPTLIFEYKSIADAK